MQTAVEWLAQQMLSSEFYIPYLEQAKEMEKCQIIDAFEEGKDTGWYQASLEAEQYYNNTFKSK